ncbi:hypothetical protein F2Q68_00005835 [Brassica cretica]|uniref:Uncharacterized protein n=1 Tax=Brassica cretica TaxID=69181 RepID=A0A8S9JBM5_BRACR|nr:hypothetical protein F2Q68_00005835 [Brassica cretica]
MLSMADSMAGRWKSLVMKRGLERTDQDGDFRYQQRGSNKNWFVQSSSYFAFFYSGTIKCIRSQLLPYATSVSSYFKKCSLPELRIKLYSIIKSLLKSMGVGMAMQLANEVVSNASVDLEGLDAIAALEALERNSSHHHRDVMVSEEGNREVVNETREGKGLAAKDSLMEEAEQLVSVDMKRIKSKSKDMKNMIDHGQEIMDRRSWTENHGQEIMDRKTEARKCVRLI